ncbi:MAG: hypothetical protein HZB92_07360 [Euryarchaeota archaeon]|nr:hypothetical protein [Euryarchaeota archaeon]
MGNEEPIREAFLIHKSGCLLAYRVPDPTKTADYDLVVGMLTALQSFVHEAFGAGMQSLRSLEFEDKNVLIEVREGFYIAVVLNGKPTSILKSRLDSVMDAIDAKYGKVAKDWNGDIGDWVHAGRMMGTLFEEDHNRRQDGLCPLCGTVPASIGNSCQICGYREEG